MTDSNSPGPVDADDDHIYSLIQRISGPEFEDLINEVRTTRERFAIEIAVADIVEGVHRERVAAA